MINKIHIQNFRSIIKARVVLSPFTLLVGANGTGKTNFLRAITNLNHNHLKMLSSQRFVLTDSFLPKHLNYLNLESELDFFLSEQFSSLENFSVKNKILRFNLNPDCIGHEEQLITNPQVNSDGSGAVAVLDALKTGDREDLFDEIEAKLRQYIPEIEKLSFVPGQATKKLQVREKNINLPIPVSDLSEGTRLVLTILTIIHQINPPNIICLEEIDRGLHPRLFQRLIELFFRMTREKNIQIIATTHNPYLVNQFKGHEEAVIIVEKENGETKFTSLAERLEGLNPEEDDPLGVLWFSGLVGGVPQRG